MTVNQYTFTPHDRRSAYAGKFPGPRPLPPRQADGVVAVEGNRYVNYEEWRAEKAAEKLAILALSEQAAGNGHQESFETATSTYENQDAAYFTGRVLVGAVAHE